MIPITLGKVSLPGPRKWKAPKRIRFVIRQPQKIIVPLKKIYNFKEGVLSGWRCLACCIITHRDYRFFLKKTKWEINRLDSYYVWYCFQFWKSSMLRCKIIITCILIVSFPPTECVCMMYIYGEFWGMRDGWDITVCCGMIRIESKWSSDGSIHPRTKPRSGAGRKGVRRSLINALNTPLSLVSTVNRSNIIVFFAFINKSLN